MIQPVMSEWGGDLHLAWVGRSGPSYASQIQYDCQEFALLAIGQALFEIARLPEYRPAEDVVSYCLNQYDRLIFAPGRNPAY
jgi:hypothetical protein